MNANKKISTGEITTLEFLIAYHAADAETQKEIRRLLGIEE